VDEAVPRRVGRGVREAERAGEVDDAGAAREQARREVGRGLRGRGEEDDVGVRRGAVRERAVAQRRRRAGEKYEGLRILR